MALRLCLAVACLAGFATAATVTRFEYPISTSSTSIYVTGTGFTTAGVVSFSTETGTGTAPTGTVQTTGLTSTSATITLGTMKTDLIGQKLTLIWTENGVSSGAKVVVSGAVTLGAPRVTTTPSIGFTTGTDKITIQGSSFDSSSVVTFSASGCTTASGCTLPPPTPQSSVDAGGTSAVFSLSGLSTGLVGKQLAASISGTGGSSGAGVVVTASITLGKPTVSVTSVAVTTASTEVVMTGSSFDTKGTPSLQTNAGVAVPVTLKSVTNEGKTATLTLTSPGVTVNLIGGTLQGKFTNADGQTSGAGFVVVSGTIALGAPSVEKAELDTAKTKLSLTGRGFQTGATVTLGSTGAGTAPTGTLANINSQGTTADVTLSPVPLNANLNGQQLTVEVKNTAGSSSKFTSTPAISFTAPALTRQYTAVTTATNELDITGVGLTETGIVVVTASGGGTPLPTAAVKQGSVLASGQAAKIVFTNAMSTALIGQYLNLEFKTAAGSSGSVQMTGTIAQGPPRIDQMLHALKLSDTSIKITGSGLKMTDILTLQSVPIGATVPKVSFSSVTSDGLNATVNLGTMDSSLIGRQLTLRANGASGQSADTVITTQITLGLPVFNPAPVNSSVSTNTTTFNIYGGGFTTDGNVTFSVEGKTGVPVPVGRISSTTANGGSAIMTLTTPIPTSLVGSQINVQVTSKAGAGATYTLVKSVTLGAPYVTPNTDTTKLDIRELVINGASFTTDNNFKFAFKVGGGTTPTGTIKAGSISTGGSLTIELNPLHSDLLGQTIMFMCNNTAGSSGWVQVTGAIILAVPYVQTFPYPVSTSDKSIVISGTSIVQSGATAVIKINGTTVYAGTAISSANGVQATITFPALGAMNQGNYLTVEYTNSAGKANKGAAVIVSDNIKLGNPALNSANTAVTTSSIFVNVTGSSLHPSLTVALLTTDRQGVPPNAKILDGSVVNGGNGAAIQFDAPLSMQLIGKKLEALLIGTQGATPGFIPLTDSITLGAPVVDHLSIDMDTSLEEIAITGRSLVSEKDGGMVIISTTDNALQMAAKIKNGTTNVHGTTATILLDPLFSDKWVGKNITIQLSNKAGTGKFQQISKSNLKKGKPAVAPAKTPITISQQTITVHGSGFQSSSTIQFFLSPPVSGVSTPTAQMESVTQEGTVAEFTFLTPLTSKMVGHGLQVIVANVLGSSKAGVNMTNSIGWGKPTVTADAAKICTTDMIELTIRGFGFGDHPNSTVTFTRSDGVNAHVPKAIIQSVGADGKTAVLAFTGAGNRTAPIPTDIVQNNARLLVSYMNPGNNSAVASTATVVTGSCTLGAPRITLNQTYAITTSDTHVTIRGSSFTRTVVTVGSVATVQEEVQFTTSPVTNLFTGTIESVSPQGDWIKVSLGNMLMTYAGNTLAAAVTNSAKKASVSTRVSDIITVGNPELNDHSLPSKVITREFNVTGRSLTETTVPFCSVNNISMVSSIKIGSTNSSGLKATLVVTLTDKAVGGRLECTLAKSATQDRKGLRSSFVTAAIAYSGVYISVSSRALYTNESSIPVTGASITTTMTCKFRGSGGHGIAPEGAPDATSVGTGAAAVIKFTGTISPTLVGQRLQADCSQGSTNNGWVDISGPIQGSLPTIFPRTTIVTTGTAKIRVHGNSLSHHSILKLSSPSTNVNIPTAYVLDKDVGDGGEHADISVAPIPLSLIGHRLLLSWCNHGNMTGCSGTPVQITDAIAAGPPVVNAMNFSATTSILEIPITGRGMSETDVATFSAVALKSLPVQNRQALTIPQGKIKKGSVSALNDKAILEITHLDVGLVGQGLSVGLTGTAGIGPTVTITEKLTRGTPIISPTNHSLTTDDPAITIHGRSFTMPMAIEFRIKSGKGTLPQGTVTTVESGGTRAVVTFKDRLSSDLQKQIIEARVMVTITGFNPPQQYSPWAQVVGNEGVTVGGPRIKPGQTIKVTTSYSSIFIEGSGLAGPPNTPASVVVESDTGDIKVPAVVKSTNADLTRAEISFVGGLTSNLVGHKLKMTYEVILNNQKNTSGQPVVVTQQIVYGAPDITVSNIGIQTNTHAITIDGHSFQEASVGGRVVLSTLLSVGSAGTSIVVPSANITAGSTGPSGGKQAVLVFNTPIPTTMIGQTLAVQYITPAGFSGAIGTVVSRNVTLGPPVVEKKTDRLTTAARSVLVTGSGFVASGSCTVAVSQGPKLTCKVTNINSGGTQFTADFGAPLDPALEGATISISFAQYAGVSPAVQISGPVLLAKPQILSSLQRLHTSATHMTLTGSSFMKDTTVRFFSPAGGTVPVGIVQNVTEGHTMAIAFTKPLNTDLIGNFLQAEVTNKAGNSGAFVTVTFNVELGLPIVDINQAHRVTTSTLEFNITGRSFYNPSTMRIALLPLLSPHFGPSAVAGKIYNGGSLMTVSTPRGFSTELVGKSLSIFIRTDGGVTNHNTTVIAGPVFMDNPKLLPQVVPITSSTNSFYINGTTLTRPGTVVVRTSGGRELANVSVSSVDTHGNWAVVSAPLIGTDLIGQFLSVSYTGSNGNSGAPTRATSVISLGAPRLDESTIPLRTDVKSLVLHGDSFIPGSAISFTSPHGTPPLGNVSQVYNSGQTALVQFLSPLSADLHLARLNATVSNSVGTSKSTFVTGYVLMASPTINEGSAYVDTNSQYVDITGVGFSVNGTCSLSFTRAAFFSVPNCTVLATNAQGTTARLAFLPAIDPLLEGSRLMVSVYNGYGSSPIQVITRPVVLMPPRIHGVANQSDYFYTHSKMVVVHGTGFIDKTYGGDVTLIATGGGAISGSLSRVYDSGSKADVLLSAPLTEAFADFRLMAVMTNTAGKSNQDYVSGLIKLGLDTCGGCVNNRDSRCLAKDVTSWDDACWAIARQRCTPPCGCVYGDWSAWTACDKPCGGGSQSRFRSTTSQFCSPPVETQVRACNTFSCNLAAGSCPDTSLVVSPTPTTKSVSVTGISGTGTLTVTARAESSAVITSVSTAYTSPSSSAVMTYTVAGNARAGTTHLIISVIDGSGFANASACAINIGDGTTCVYSWGGWGSCDGSCKQSRQEVLSSGASTCAATRYTESRTCSNCKVALSCASVGCGLRSRNRGECGCDAGCTSRGDCCTDYSSVCKAYSCNGKCGSQASPAVDTCWCDSTCAPFNDCCPDYYDVCVGNAQKPTSCGQVGCGYRSQHNGGCACDSACTNYGDCCSDYSSSCATIANRAGLASAVPTWFSTLSQGFSSLLTGTPKLGKAPAVNTALSCSGQCGGESVGQDGSSCWCDALCTDDCCADKAQFCS